jgi:hypothetical protein
MKADRKAAVALAGGRAQAQRVVEARRRARAKRARKLKELEPVAPARARAPIPRAFRVQPASPLGVLVAEGDSWFDYPWTDVLGELEHEHLYDVESVAHYGHRLEEMAYSDGQLEKLVRTLERVVESGRRLTAVLLSGGGNDIAGAAEFGMILNHADSPAPGLNEAVVAGVIDERLRHSYVRILGAVTEACVELTGARVPILIHGYDYAVPDGRGVLGGVGPLPGPWLQPGLHAKRYARLARGKELVAELIDRFNAMLARVARVPEFRHVHHVDLRGALPSGASYKDWWSNELHPEPRGFARVARRFAAVLDGLGAG